MRYPTSSPRFSTRVLPARRADSDCTRYNRNAFTLIELLTVIAIIGILAGITFGITKGVNERAAINQARTELSALATALENYKRQYGDYPQTGPDPGTAATTVTITVGDPAAQFLNALSGKLGPTLKNISGKNFVELGRFTLETENLPDPAATNAVSVANAFLDPWGRRYMYCYKDQANPGTWNNPSYVLFSTGPDGKRKASDPTSAGVVDYADTDNIDNIYVNR